MARDCQEWRKIALEAKVSMDCSAWGGGEGIGGGEEEEEGGGEWEEEEEEEE
jgi:hypothetical protein